MMDNMLTTDYDGCGKCMVAARRLSRVSDSTSSPERQAEQILIAVEAIGGHIIAWADDWEVSGATEAISRKGIGPWLQGKMGPYAGVVAAAVDRIGRDQLDVLLTGRMMRTQKKLLLTYGHPGPWKLDDTADEMLYSMQSMGAQMELRAIQKRNRDDTERARKNGKVKQRPSYGYQFVRLTPTSGVHHVEIDDVAAEVIRTVAERILLDTEGEITHYTEATRLNREKVHSPLDRLAINYGRPTKGVMWSSRGLKNILTSVAALGFLVHDGKAVLDEEGNPMRIAPPLWDAATRKALIEKTTPKRVDPRAGQRAPKGQRLLTGRAYCGNCGTKLSCSSLTKERTYRCEGRSKGLPGAAECKPAPGIYMSILDKAVEEWFLANYGSKKLFHKVYDAGTSHQARIAELEANRERLREDREAGLYDAPDDAEWFRRRYASMGKELTELKKLPERPAKMRWMFTGKTPRDHWREAQNDIERRELLASYQVRVTLWPENSRHERYWITGVDPDAESEAREDSAIAYRAELDLERDGVDDPEGEAWLLDQAHETLKQERDQADTPSTPVVTTAKELETD